MKTIYLLIIILLVGCKPQHNNKEERAESDTTPKSEFIIDCISERILLFSKGLQCSSGAQVNAYEFKGKLVYVFKEGPCTSDMQQPVLNEDCIELGLLGGFLGNNIILDTSFSEAVFQKNVWKQVPKK